MEEALHDGAPVLPIHDVERERRVTGDDQQVDPAHGTGCGGGNFRTLGILGAAFGNCLEWSRVIRNFWNLSLSLRRWEIQNGSIWHATGSPPSRAVTARDSTAHRGLAKLAELASGAEMVLIGLRPHLHHLGIDCWQGRTLLARLDLFFFKKNTSGGFEATNCTPHTLLNLSLAATFDVHNGNPSFANKGCLREC